MKNIIILFELTNQTNLMKEFQQNVQDEIFQIDVFNVSKCSFITPISVLLPFWLKAVLFLMKNKFIRKGLSVFYNRNSLILRLVSYYNIVDIHFYSDIYHDLIPKFIHKKKNVKITIWGSDLYRTDKKCELKRIRNFELVDSVCVATEQMKNDFSKRFGDFKSKISVVPFGIGRYRIIDEMPSVDAKRHFIPLLYIDRLVLVCGYNGSKAQQHEWMVNSLMKLPIAIKERLFVIIPMTYGGTLEYVEHIKQLMNDINIPYKILSNYLCNREVAQLRIASDIVLNIQITDAFSASLQEHLYAGNILIIAEWLKYSTLDENSVFYLKAKECNITKMIEYSVENFQYLKMKSCYNKEKMYKISAWESVCQSQVNIYKCM